MPRNPNITYEKIAHWLSAVNKPATIQEIAAAGVAATSTLYRLLADQDKTGIRDLPVAAKVHGIIKVGAHHYAYSDPANAEIMDKVVAQQFGSLKEAASSLSEMAKGLPALDYISKSLLEAFEKHREDANAKTLQDNFAMPSLTVEQYIATLDSLKDKIGDDLPKFRTLLISMFVSSFNRSAS